MHCASCSHENRATARFCEACGERLGADAAGLVRDAPEPLEADRRVVSVLFCDLVGSTELADRLDVEDLRDLVLAYQEICAGVIRRHAGHLKQYLGDGVLAYFGYPVAQEDDARAAIEAGLEIVREVQATGDRPGVAEGGRLSARVAVHSGLVVAGDMGGWEGRDPHTVVGATPNIAARLQSIAAPDSVVVSESTLRLTAGFFETRDLGDHEIRGLTTPVRVHEVCGKTGLESRLEVAAAAGLTPLVGRTEEMTFLLDRWRAAENGDGQIVVLGGEPGIGKSRLTAELATALGDGTHVYLEARCSPQHQQSAFHPLIGLLGRTWKLDRGTDPERLDALGEAIAELSLDADEALPLLADLLSVPLPPEIPTPNLSARRRRERTLELLLDALAEASRVLPVLLVIEDLHWIDPSSLDLLGRVFARIREPGARVLALATHRPVFRPPWQPDDKVTHLTLTRLGSEQAVRMCELVAGGKGLPDAVVHRLREKTDGIPLYVEELTRMVLELGVLREEADRYELDGRLPAFAIPDTLQESLVARLDRLAPVKEVLQLGAALGRSFSYELIREVASLDEATLRSELARLVDADVLQPHGNMPSETHYAFRHALIQEAAYESLLKSRRRKVHRHIAEAVRRSFPDVERTHPEILAHHYEAAELPSDAVFFRQLAGDVSLQRSAEAEAVSHYRKGLELLELLPESPERVERELGLLTALGVALMPLKGYAAPEVEEVFTRARQLCQQSGETRQLFSTLAGLGNFHQSRAELHVALDLAEHRLELARSLGDPSMVMQAHEAVGTVSLWLGNFRASQRHLETGDAIYDAERHRDLALVYGQDLGVVFRAYGAHGLWFLGFGDRALERSQEALELASELRHPNSLALATDFAAALHMVRREPEPALGFAEDAIALATEQHFPFWLGYGMIMRGWALAKLGSPQEGREQLLQGMKSYQGTGAQLGGRFCIGILAEVHYLCGDVDAGIAALEGVLPTLEANEDRFWEAEVHRLRGELHLARTKPNRAVAEACFQRAIEISRRQAAQALELRAVTSLARLWLADGRTVEAHAQLEPVLARLAEGGDTTDQRDARALLAAAS